LQFELDFLQQGAYGRSVRSPRTPRVPFVDSPSCLNFLEPERPHACNGCALMDFVPEAAQGSATPCHHIPLDAQGHTIADLATASDDPKTIDALEHWLRATIDRLRCEQGARSET
jgi:hypothetical protein